MLFNSYIFIFLFLPVTLLGWYILNHMKAYEPAKLFLAGMSLWFYGYFNIYYLGVIVVSILGNFLISWVLKIFHGKRMRRIGLISGLLLNMGFLFYFKYYDFFFENINAVFRTSFNLKHIVRLLESVFLRFNSCPLLLTDAWERRSTTVLLII